MQAASSASAAAGLLLLTRPQQVLDAVAPAFPRERRGLVRALGARMLVQHAAVLTRPEPRPGTGAPARISGAVALGSAVAGRVLAGSQRR